jgi:hypothetical protein
MQIDRRAFLLAPAALALPLAAPAMLQHATAMPGGPHVNHHRGLALRGYDSVAWHREGRPLRGQSRFAAEWDGASWHFASAAHRDAFMAAPARLAPAYGGFCAFGVARGYKVDIDPEAWHIHDGRLFLNYDRGVQRQWQRDIPGHIAAADANWPRLRSA